VALRKWTFSVALEDAGLRLDQLVAKHTGLSRRQAREALRLGGVQVARKRMKVAGRIVPAGTEVRVALDDDLGEPPKLAIPILFEDAWLLAVNKPAGIPTQGTWATDRHDLLALLRAQRPELQLFLHHRLDQGTSGVLLFAIAKEANLGMTRAFEGRLAEKVYLARLSEPLDACEVELPIGRLRQGNPGRFACSGDLIDPRPAKTSFAPADPAAIAGLAPGPWILARPHTGRTHQIRVHLAHLDRPIFGDTLYGGEPAEALWLHAWKLRLPHPVTGEALEIIAPPDRFQVGQGILSA
jgi:23S rRNA pseudouridine1911/1915/1917 synthase